MKSFFVGDVGPPQPWLQILVVFLAVSKLNLGVERSLRPQTATPVLLRNHIIFDERLLPLGQVGDFFPFSFVEEPIHLVVRLVFEDLVVQELLPVLYISELLERPPVPVVVILEDEVFGRVALLGKAIATSLTKLYTLSFCFSVAFSLSSKCDWEYLRGGEDIWRSVLRLCGDRPRPGRLSCIGAGCT